MSDLRSKLFLGDHAPARSSSRCGDSRRNERIDEEKDREMTLGTGILCGLVRLEEERRV